MSLFQQQPEKLLRVTAGPTNTIQVARIPATTFVFPWAAVYDLPLDPAPDSRLEPCPLVATWDDTAAQFANYPSRCPEDARHKAKNTLCPFGFWGIRHVIEHPPSAAGRTPPRQVQIVGEPHIVVVRSQDLDRGLGDRHIASVGHALPGLTLTSVASRDEACTALADHDLELVEFYCHGKGDSLRHWLEVGHGEEIHPEQIATWALADWAPPERHWHTTTPLILLNGCHTTELTPQSPVNFVDTFAAANAGGVIGTEITLHQSLANEAVELMLHHFAQGGFGMGEVLRRMRHDLLAKGNLLGLAYTAYCSADLRLVGPNAERSWPDGS